jgi:mRNA interferase HigB
MHVIAKKKFLEAARKYPNEAQAIMDTYIVLRKTNCRTPQQLLAIFPTLERFTYKKDWYVINIAGNKMRLLAMIFFKGQKVYAKYVVDHKEYERLIKKYAKEQ